MPKWHSVIESELIRSLLLAGAAPAMLALTPLPASTNPRLQSDTASHSSMGLEGPNANPSGSSLLLLADGKLNRQAAEAASAQSYPVLLQQALTLALSADWGPGDFGACESESSDSSASESSGSEQAEDSATLDGLAAAGHDKVLAMAVLAASHVCDQSNLSKDDNSRAKSGDLANEVTLCITCMTGLEYSQACFDCQGHQSSTGIFICFDNM